MNKTLLKKALNVTRKIVKWYLIADVIYWAVVGLKELEREDVKNDAILGSWSFKLLKESFYSLKDGKYVSFYSWRNSKKD